MSRAYDEHQLADSIYAALERPLTPELSVRRVFPQRAIRMLGPWCFLDHFGPLAPSSYRLFDVPPHPHIGLQTITWLLSGELMHFDSLGYQQPLHPGQLNLMTSGRGISHAEVAQPNPTTPLHGLQLWCALPPAHEETDPRFDHYPSVPSFTLGQCQATLITGSYATATQSWHSPALSFSPHIALLLEAAAADTLTLHLQPEFEHGIYVLHGNVRVNGTGVPAHHLLDLGAQRDAVTLELSQGCTLLLLGGEPFAQPVKIWWNFVSASQARVEQAQRDWDAGHPRFGKVPNYTAQPREAATGK